MPTAPITLDALRREPYPLIVHPPHRIGDDNWKTALLGFNEDTQRTG